MSRTGSGSGGGHVYVDVSNTNVSDTSFSCVAYSKDNAETLLVSQTLNANVNGAYRFDFNLKGAQKSSKWSTYGVVCTLPATGRILDVELAE
jgi:hypothetical protein